MYYKHETALRLMDLWRAFSKEALVLLYGSTVTIDMLSKKTSQWASSGPKGVVFHYTGGIDAKASLKWCFNPENTGSSWPITVWDGPSEWLLVLHDKYEEICRLFPATAILHAPLDRTTWHGNWANRYTFGIENRNLGRLEPGGYRLSGERKLLPINPIVSRGTAQWESFTREQIITNIQIGRLLLGLYPHMEPRWFIPHSAVHAGKSDTGGAFPLVSVRTEIFSHAEISEMEWLNSFASGGIWTEKDVIDEGIFVPSTRASDDTYVDAHSPAKKYTLMSLDPALVKSAAQMLSTLGYAMGDYDDLVFALSTFQRSTQPPHGEAWAKKHGALEVTGSIDDNVLKALRLRIQSLGLELPS